MNRRYFLMGAAALNAPGRKAVAGPNDTVRVAFAGVNGEGKEHIVAYAGKPKAEIAAICGCL
jgi:hypothetical protein